jgi:hypothetical protein
MKKSLLKQINQMNESELMEVLEHLSFELRGTLCQNGTQNSLTSETLEMVSSDLLRASKSEWTEDEIDSFQV